MAPLPRPQWGTAADNGSSGTPTRHTSGTDVARPEHGALARREYGLLSPTGMAVDPADAGELGNKDGHESTRGTAGHYRRETEEGDETRQRTLPARIMQGSNDKGRIPPVLLRALNACGFQGGGAGGDPPPSSARPRRVARNGGGVKHGSACP